MTPLPSPPRTRPALCLSLISSVISEAEWMWSLNDLQIDSTLRLCLSPSMSSNCTLCEGVAFIGFSQHLILISMSDQSPLLSHFFLIGFRELRGWRSSDDYLDFSKRLSWGGGFGGGGLGTVLLKLIVSSNLWQNIVFAFKKAGRKPFRLTFRGANLILDAWWWSNWFHSSLWTVMTFLSCQKQCRRLVCEPWHEKTQRQKWEI